MSDELYESMQDRRAKKIQRQAELEEERLGTKAGLATAQDRATSAGWLKLQAEQRDREAFDQRVADTLARAPKPEASTPIPQPQDVVYRPFGTLRKDAPIVEQLSQTFAMLGTLAQMSFGMSKGFALGAQAAYSGALAGWAEGDAKRADAEWKIYRQNLEYARADNERKMHDFDMLSKNFGHDLERLKYEAYGLAAREKYGEEAEKLILQDVTGYRDRLTAIDREYDKAETTLDKIEGHMVDVKKKDTEGKQPVRAARQGWGWMDRRTGRPASPTKADFAAAPPGTYVEVPIPEGEPGARGGRKDTTAKDQSQALSRNRTQARSDVVAQLRHVPKEIWGGFKQQEQKEIIDYYEKVRLRELAAEDPMLADMEIREPARPKIVDTFENKADATGEGWGEWFKRKVGEGAGAVRGFVSPGAPGQAPQPSPGQPRGGPAYDLQPAPPHAVEGKRYPGSDGRVYRATRGGDGKLWMMPD